MHASYKKWFFNVFLNHPAIADFILLQKQLGLFQVAKDCNSSTSVSVFTWFAYPDRVFKLICTTDLTKLCFHVWTTLKVI